MGGGLMQLVAMGAQDVFLTGNPQITFFKVVYRRHTNFSKECIVQEFNGSVPSIGGTSSDVTCTLARNGDLVQEIYLKATVNAIDTKVPIDINNFGNNILQNINNPLVVKNEQIIYFNKTITKIKQLPYAGKETQVDIELNPNNIINITGDDRIQFSISVGSISDINLPIFLIPSTKPTDNDLLTINILNYINVNSSLITASIIDPSKLELKTNVITTDSISVMKAQQIKNGPFTIQSNTTDWIVTLDTNPTINKDDEIKFIIEINNINTEIVHKVSDSVEINNNESIQQFMIEIVATLNSANKFLGTYSSLADQNSLIISKTDSDINNINTEILVNFLTTSNEQLGILPTPIQYENVFEKNIKYKIKNLNTNHAFNIVDLNSNNITFTNSGIQQVGDLDSSSIGPDLELFFDSSSLDNDISNLIQTVELEIGGQKIDKHYAAWFDIYNELFEKNHDYRRMLTRGAPGNNKIVYIPLRFWFNRNAGLALPLIALQYHEVKILMNLKVPNISTLLNANLLVNYVYLDTDERRRFAKVSHEYLIEQVQHTGIESIDGSSNNGSVDMNFNHPVKALFWSTELGKNYLKNVKLQLNGHDRFIEQGPDYFHLVQPYECGLGNGHSLDPVDRTWGDIGNCNKTNSVCMYSFCLKPCEHQPSGSCNFSRIDNAKLHYAPGEQGGASDNDNLHLFALNYNVLRIMSGMGGLTYSN